ncbi:MAG TPA: hypothetical protein VGF16_00490 [Bryobacteraceae bacterium]
MPCPQRWRLMIQYSRAVASFEKRVARLQDAALSYETDAFDRAWEGCEAARRHCDDVRLCLYEHLEAHHCGLELARHYWPKAAAVAE